MRIQENSDNDAFSATFLQQANTHSDKVGASYEASIEYFCTRFSGIEVDSNLLTDYQDGPMDDRIEKYTAVLPVSIQAAEAFLHAAGVTEGTLFLGAFAFALAKFTGQSKSLFCVVESGMYDQVRRATQGLCFGAS